MTIAFAVVVVAGCGGGGKGGSQPVDAGAVDATPDHPVDSGGGFTCTLPPIAANFDRTWDVHVATVSGTITLAGATLPDSPDLTSRGTVIFRRRDTHVERSVALAATGAGSFSATLFAGVYDIDLETSVLLSLPQRPPSVLPSGARTRLASGIALAGGERFNYDLHLMTFTGTVTAGGAPLPDSPGIASRGSVLLHDRLSGGSYDLPVSATGPGSFSGAVFPGTYDVDFYSAGDPALVGLPSYAETRLASGVALGDASGPPRTYDLQIASVSGKITMNGAALPDSPQTARGSLVFRDPSTRSVALLAIPSTGTASYSGLLFAGTHDVSFKTAIDSLLIGLPVAKTVPLASGIAVRGAMTGDYDLNLVTVSGTITAQGAPLPAISTEVQPAAVSFIDRTNASVTRCNLPKSGDSTFSCSLFGGSYDVGVQTATDFNHLTALFTSGVSRLVATAVTIDRTTTLSYDLPAVVPVSGTITLGGATLPDSATIPSRGLVVFRDQLSGSTIRLPLAAIGPGAFAGDLFAGTYDVDLVTLQPAGLVGLPPEATFRLASSITVGAPAPSPFAWDATVISLAGRITLDGAALPDSSGIGTRGNIIFQEKVTGSQVSLALPATGPGVVSGTAFPGSYDVTLSTGSDTGLIGLPISAQTDLDVGCLSPRACTADRADISGIWTLVFRDRFRWYDWSVVLSQTGPDLLMGRFFSFADYRGSIDPSPRTGDAIQLFTSSSACSFRIDAQLSGGCLMTGVGICDGRTGAVPAFLPSPFVGFR